VHTVPCRQLADRHIRIIPTVPTDRFEHPDTTPNRHSGPPSRRQRRPAWGGARSDRHNRPGVSRPGPDQAVTVGPNQSVISTSNNAETDTYEWTSADRGWDQDWDQGPKSHRKRPSQV